MYCTPFIEELLFYSCQQINQALAHGLDKYDLIPPQSIDIEHIYIFRELSNEISYRLLQTFLNVYESWWTNEGQNRLSKKRIQTRVIQMVYDLRFVHMLLERKDNSTVRNNQILSPRKFSSVCLF